MRIKIKTKDVSLPFLFLPNCLIGSRLSLRILVRIFPNVLPASQKEQQEILHMYKQLRKSFRGMTLIEVHTAQGETIKVTF